MAKADLLARFGNKIEQHKLLDKKLLLAVSGGADSMALLHLALETKLSFIVAHFDHQMRENSHKDAEFVQKTCENLNIKHKIDRVDVPKIAKEKKWSLEEAARKLRYSFLMQTAKQFGAETILTAHHFEDNAETILLQLLRGTGRAIGIREKHNQIVRPMLEFSKKELKAYLLDNNLHWVEDESNSDTKFSRNWLRNEIIPLLKRKFPDFERSLVRYAQISLDENDYFERLIDDLNKNDLDLRKQNIAIQRLLIKKILEDHKIAVDFNHIEEICNKLNEKSVQRTSLSHDNLAVIQDGRVSIAEKDKKFQLKWPENIDFCSFPDAILRTRQPGDWIRLNSGKKKLSDLFIDLKIPREERDFVPLIAIGSEILSIGLEYPIFSARFNYKDPDFIAMGEAIKLAKEAFDANEVPIGAVVLYENEIIGRGRNRCVEYGDMTKHAELLAINEASKRIGSYLNQCTLVVTLEPCPMCLGAIIESRIKRIVFGAKNYKSGALGSIANLIHLYKSQIDVRSGIKEKEIGRLLTDFFTKLR